jgi:hypothetical protein
VHTASVRKMSASIARARRAAFAVASSLFVAVALAACGSGTDTAPRVPASIVITTPSGTTSTTGTIQFSATVKDADGHTINVAPTWSVVNGGGTITSTGLFTAGDSIGTFTNTVVATSGSVTSSSTVVVGGGALATITVTASDSMSIGATHQFVAVGRDAHGNVVSIPNRVWSVAHAGGSIDTAGVFTADTVAGTFANTVTATSGSISGAASVIVRHDPLERIRVNPDTVRLAAGTQQTLTATGYDTYNNAFPISGVSWFISGGGTIDTAGVLTADTVAGTFPNAVFARFGNNCGDPYANATVIVQPGPLTTITISPANPGVMVGQTRQFTATGADAYGNPIAITPSWSVIGPGGGTIDASTGLYTAGSMPGTYTNSVAAFVNSLVGVTSVQIFFPMPPSLRPPPPPIVINPSY